MQIAFKTVEPGEPLRQHSLDPQTGATLGNVLDTMAAASVKLGHEIVDVSGFLEGVDDKAGQQIDRLKQAKVSVTSVSGATGTMVEATDRLSVVMGGLIATLESSSAKLADALHSSRHVVGWVSGVGSQLTRVDTAMQAAQSSNARILAIAREVSMLSINARIEAARAGESGRGFAVVAEAISSLSSQTAEAARTISETVGALAAEISVLRTEARTVAQDAEVGLVGLASAETALARLGSEAAAGEAELGAMGQAAGQMRLVVDEVGPTFAALHDGVAEQISHVNIARKRVAGLIKMSETMIQQVFSLGGATEDQLLIEDVMARANSLGALLQEAVARNEISMTALFSDDYRPIAGTNPVQMMAPFTALTDRLFPQVQEAALAQDGRIIFCAAVDRNGYLPTHNKKFSAVQSADPVWNAANCRNRRIFNDRVGLGAGRSEKPFLMQIYRRDMGGGTFALMKDVSAPIFVNGAHWGGLRLAYSF